MPSSDQRDLESGHFKIFRSGVPDFPDGEVLHEDEPDFLVRTPGGTLGIEHRQIFRPSPALGPQLQAVESQRGVTMRQAQELCELRGLPPLSVSVDFAPGTIPAERRYDLARELASLCAGHLPAAGGRIEFERSPSSPDLLPKAVRSLFIARPRTEGRSHWSDLAAGAVLEGAREVLQMAINEKAARLDSYLQRCGRCWLLLAADALRPSSFIEIDEKTASNVYESPFERTYFLNCFDGVPIALRTDRPQK